MTTAEALLAGSRGRRMLLAYARDAERILHSEFRSDSFDYAVSLGSYHLESGREGAHALFGPGAEEARRTVLTADDVAHRLSQVPLPEVTALALRSALVDAVDAARYWQDPDGEDILVATEPVRRELRRVAEHLARSAHAQWWTTPVATDQWVVGWSEDGADSGDSTTAELLRNYRDRTVAEEVEQNAIAQRIRRRTGPAGGGRLHRHGVRPGCCSTAPRPACGSSRTAWDGNAPSRDE